MLDCFPDRFARGAAPIIHFSIAFYQYLISCTGDIAGCDPFVGTGEIKVGILCERSSVARLEVQRCTIYVNRVLSFGHDVNQLVDGVDHKGFRITGTVGIVKNERLRI